MARYFRDWIEQASRMCPLRDKTEPEYLFWAAASAVAGALGRKCFFNRASPGKSYIHPNMFVILCGESGLGKSTALDVPHFQAFGNLSVTIGKSIAGTDAEGCGMVRPLHQMIGKMTAQKLIQNLSKLSKNALVPELSTGSEPFYDSSITAVSSEFKWLLRATDEDLHSILTDAWDGRPLGNNTVMRDDEVVVGPFYNMIGGTTPDQLSEILPIGSGEQGLVSRLVIVHSFMKPPPQAALYETKDVDSRDLARLTQDLATIGMLSGEFKLESKELAAELNAWGEQGCPPKSVEPLASPMHTRIMAHTLKLSMVLSAARSNDMTITRDDVEEAKRRLWIVEQRVHVPLGHTQLGEAGRLVENIRKDVVYYLRSLDKSVIPATKLKRQIVKRSRNASDVESIMSALIGAGYMQWVDDGHTLLEVKNVKEIKEPEMGQAD